MGVVLLLMTIIVKVLVYPATYKSYMSSAKMRVLKPYINEIKRKISQERRCFEKATGNDGTLQQIRSKPYGRLLAYADPNAGIHGFILLRA